VSRSPPPRLFALTVLLSLTAVTSAAALPRDFWGAVPQGPLTDAQLSRLKRGGVDSIRVPFHWSQARPREPLDWSGTDAQVAALARADLQPFPFLYGAPRWAVRPRPVPGTRGAVTAPARLPAHGRAARGWAAFARGAVARYGPRGSFWAENPDLPRRPVHTWQVWNEQNFKYFVVRPNPAEYARFLRRSAWAIRGADRRARIVLGGLFARPAEATRRFRPPRAYFAAEFLDQMYRRSPGIGSKFDGVGLHPYSASYRHLPGTIGEVRRVLRRHRDAGKGLWITELGWSSQRPSRRNSFAKGRRGQAAQLKGAFRLLRRHQGRWRLRQVFWFSVDDQAGSCNFCGGSGLFAPGFRPKPAWRAYVRFSGGRAR
jgi:hypothetical protein